MTSEYSEPQCHQLSGSDISSESGKNRCGDPVHGNLGPVSTVESLVGEWLPLPDVAEILDISITRVHSLIEERSLVALRVGERNIRSVPAAFILDGQVVDSLRGTIVVLADAGYSDADLVTWLFTADESLRGRPVDALREGRKTEIRRRAQTLAW